MYFGVYLTLGFIMNGYTYFIAAAAFMLSAVTCHAATIHPLIFECAGAKVSAEFVTNFDLSSLGAVQTRLTVVSEFGEKTILNFVSGSFGAECRSNALNWRGYVVFQTACPSQPSPKDKAERCDYDNNFGIIRGSESLLVPHEKNGKLAAELFNYPSKSREKMKPVSTHFNVHGK